MVGTGKGAESGILIKGGEALEGPTSSTRWCSTRPAPSPGRARADRRVVETGSEEEDLEARGVGGEAASTLWVRPS